MKIELYQLIRNLDREGLIEYLKQNYSSELLIKLIKNKILNPKEDFYIISVIIPNKQEFVTVIDSINSFKVPINAFKNVNAMLNQELDYIFNKFFNIDTMVRIFQIMGDSDINFKNYLFVDRCFNTKNDNIIFTCIDLIPNFSEYMYSWHRLPPSLLLKLYDTKNIILPKQFDKNFFNYIFRRNRNDLIIKLFPYINLQYLYNRIITCCIENKNKEVFEYYVKNRTRAQYISCLVIKKILQKCPEFVHILIENYSPCSKIKEELLCNIKRIKKELEKNGSKKN